MVGVNMSLQHRRVKPGFQALRAETDRSESGAAGSRPRVVAPLEQEGADFAVVVREVSEQGVMKTITPAISQLSSTVAIIP